MQLDPRNTSFLHADQVADMDAIERYSKIIGQEIRRVLVVGQYSTHTARRHDHYIGPSRAQITLGFILTGEIKLGALRNEHSARFLSETTHDCRAGPRTPVS